MLKPKKDGFTILHIAATKNDIHTLDYAIRTKETTSIDLCTEDVLVDNHDDIGLDSSTFGFLFRKHGLSEFACGSWM